MPTIVSPIPRTLHRFALRFIKPPSTLQRLWHSPEIRIVSTSDFSPAVENSNGAVFPFDTCGTRMKSAYPRTKTIRSSINVKNKGWTQERTLKYIIRYFETSTLLLRSTFDVLPGRVTTVHQCALLGVIVTIKTKHQRSSERDLFPFGESIPWMCIRLNRNKADTFSKGKNKHRFASDSNYRLTEWLCVETAD